MGVKDVLAQPVKDVMALYTSGAESVIYLGRAAGVSDRAVGFSPRTRRLKPAALTE